MASIPDWLWTALAAALALAAAVIASRALFTDRPRGRRRCPRCWYDLSDSPGLTCSECGHTALSDRRLLRTRRHWRWLPAAAVVLALAWASYQVPTIKRDGWVRAVPTTALVLWPMSTRGWLDRAAFKTGSPPSSLDAELERRVANLELHRWQELILEYRFAVASGIDKRGALCAYECTDLGRVCWAPLRNNGCFREPVGPEWIQGVCDVDASALEWLVTGTVDTESWAINGGDGGALRVLCGKLVVQTSAASHQQIQVLLNGLRAAMASRGNPTAVLPPNVQRLSHDFAPDNHVVQDNR